MSPSNTTINREAYLALFSFLFFSLRSRATRMSDRKAVIKNADMSEEMQQDAVDCATQALEKYNIEKVCIDKSNMFCYRHCVYDVKWYTW